MDDRFHKESFNGERNSLNPDSYTNPNKKSLGDFSENIDSTRAVFGAGTSSEPPKIKKFQVHIPDSELSYTGNSVGTEPQMKQNPVRPAASSSSSNPPRRPSAPTGRAVPGSRQVMSASAANTAKKKPVAAKKAPAKSKKPQSSSGKGYDIIKNLLAACVCLIFIAIITVSVSTIAMNIINDILVIDSDSGKTAMVEIPEGADYDDVYKILCDNGLVRQEFLTDIFLRFRNYHEVEVYNKTTQQYEIKRIQYQSGTYYLNSGDGIEKMIEQIMVKSHYAKDTVRLTFPEGWSIAQIFEKIEKYEVCSAEMLYANLDVIGAQYGFISDITEKPGRYLTCEGYLFPDTYDFFVGENASSVLKKLFNNFKVKIADFEGSLSESEYTLDEIITIASIIQREAKDKSQMADISSVIYNRLALPGSYPNIQMNSTTDYVTALEPYNLFSDTYYNLYLDKYNTYSQTGLPPGPICNPGWDAINAAFNPSDTDYCFFCHDKAGNIYLAETAQEHAENTATVLYGDIG